MKKGHNKKTRSSTPNHKGLAPCLDGVSALAVTLYSNLTWCYYHKTVSKGSQVSLFHSHNSVWSHNYLKIETIFFFLKLGWARIQGKYLKQKGPMRCSCERKSQEEWECVLAWGDSPHNTTGEERGHRAAWRSALKAGGGHMLLQMGDEPQLPWGWGCWEGSWPPNKGLSYSYNKELMIHKSSLLLGHLDYETS